MSYSQEFITLRGARENNLKDVDLHIPKRKITVFTGVSGSGKSSIVFDTIATEAQRQLYENFSMFIRGFLPKYPQPDADEIADLSMAVIVDQKRMGGGSHSTVGTITDIYTILRMLYSRIGQPHVGTSNYFSFNDPAGMCLTCNGTGQQTAINSDGFFDLDKSLNEGAIQVPLFVGWELQAYTASGFFDNDKKLRDYSDDEMELLLHGKDRKFKINMGGSTMNLTYQGVIEKLTASYIRRDLKTLSKRTQDKVAPYLTMGECSDCHGARLNKTVLSCKINGLSIADMTSMEVGQLREAITGIAGDIAKPLIASLQQRLGYIVDIGLDYISLNRETDSLSGGESQRIKMVKNLSSSLVDVTYIFDEPSVGLHVRDVHRLNELLEKLRDKGNTVLVVEHDPDVIKIADHVIDVGPGAGAQGGHVVFEGSYDELLRSGTLTGNHLQDQLPTKADIRQPNGVLPIAHANVNNLQDVSVDIPVGVFTVVTGVAGSGKSSLINKVFLAQHPEAVVIDQSPVGVNSRSNPATYTGIMDDVRKAFAAANKVDAGLFSFNSKGACENCNGQGVVYTDLAFLDGVKSPCDVCQGRRFKDEVLELHLNGMNVSEVLELTIDEALNKLDIAAVAKKLQALSDVGLGYLSLGQPLSTLSGGECQRIKIASELHKKGSIYVMDEPTTGLHMSNIGDLMRIINRLVDGGNTVIAIEHNLDVIRQADWIIDMGPEGGTRGGLVVFEGTPTELRKAKDSLTAKYV